MNHARGTFSSSQDTMSVESFTLIFRALRLIGLWSRPSDGWGYLFYSFLVVLNPAYLVLSVVLQVAPKLARVHDWAMFFSLAIGFSAFYFKNMFFVVFRARLGTLVDNLCITSTSSDVRARKIFILFHTLLNTTLLLFYAIPLLKKVVSKEARHEADFPLDLWYPFDMSNTLTYVLTYLWQGLTIFYVSHTAINIDIYFLTLFNEIGLQMDDLNNRLASLKPDTERREESCIMNDKEILTSFRNKIGHHSRDAELDGFMFKELVRSITHHQALIRVVYELETLMSYCMFAQVFFNVVNMTLYVISLSTSHPEIFSSFRFFACLLFCFLQNGLYCWFGDTLIRKSEQLMVSVYSCDWASSSPRCKCALLILMIRASKPLHVKIGKLYGLSRETFLQMLNSAYGLFNVLYKIDGSKEEH